MPPGVYVALPDGVQQITTLVGDLIRDDFGIRWTLFAMIVLLIATIMIIGTTVALKRFHYG